MPVLLTSQDFTETNFKVTLIRLLQAYYKGDDIISQVVVPVEFRTFSLSKGCELNVTVEIVGSGSNYAGRKIVPATDIEWDIHPGDVVRFKSELTLNKMNVVKEDGLLVEVDYFDNELTNKLKWVFKADVELIHKASGGFRNEGE